MWAFLFIKFEPSCAGMKTIFLLFFISLLYFDSFSQCDKYIQVVESVTLKPIANMYLNVYNVGANYEDIYMSYVTSDSNGVVKLSMCPDMHYRAYTHADGYYSAQGNIEKFAGDTFVIKVERIISPRYVKVVDSRSGEPLDSFDISFYKIPEDGFEYVGSETTDTLGLARVPISLGLDSGFFGMINAYPSKLPRDHHYHYGSDRKYVYSVIRDTIIFKAVIVPGRRIFPQDIYFAVGQINIVDFYKENDEYLPAVLEVLKKNPKWKVELDGHTDNRGTDEYNLALSQKRADTVKAYLVSQEINEDRIITKAFGSSVPIEPNEKNGQDDPKGRELNRRVEFKIIPVD